jgi:hypothetical protein
MLQVRNAFGAMDSFLPPLILKTSFHHELRNFLGFSSRFSRLCGSAFKAAGLRIADRIVIYLLSVVEARVEPNP